MFTLPASFRAILTGLRAALGVVMARDHASIPLLTLIHTRIGRAITRFERLFARFRANTLPKPRKSRAGQTRPHQPRPRPAVPNGRTWLVVACGYQVAGFASQLQHLLAHTPDLADFLAAAPQAARILRPLCHMLGVTAPGLHDPRASVRPRPRQPRAPIPVPRPSPAPHPHDPPPPRFRFLSL